MFISLINQTYLPYLNTRNLMLDDLNVHFTHYSDIFTLSGTLTDARHQCIPKWTGIIISSCPKTSTWNKIQTFENTCSSE